MNRTTKFRLKVVFWYTAAFVSATAVSMAALDFAMAEEMTAEQRIAEAFGHVQAAPASPQGCLPRAEMRLAMAARYGETVQIFARTDPTHIIEFYASRKRTWTAVATGPEGMSCMIQGGDGWTGPIPEPEPETGPALYRIEPGSVRPA